MTRLRSQVHRVRQLATRDLERARTAIEAARDNPGLYGLTRQGHTLLCYAEDLLNETTLLRARCYTLQQQLLESEARMTWVKRKVAKV